MTRFQRKGREEHELKAALRARALKALLPAGNEAATEEEPGESRVRSNEPVEPGLKMDSAAAPTAALEASPNRTLPAQDVARKHKTNTAASIRAHEGSDVTRFTGELGRAVKFRERLMSVGKTFVARPTSYYGRHLTLHHRGKGIPVPVHRFSQIGRIKPASFFTSLWLAIRWFFSWRIKVLVIERYVFNEALGSFLLGTMGFTFFMIITSVFTLGEVIFSKHMPPFTIAKILLLLAPQILVLAVPIAVLFSTLMAMGRLNRDNEIIAMTTNGVSLYRIFIPFLTIAMIGSLLTWVTYEYVVPPNAQEYVSVLKQFVGAQVTQFIKPQIMIRATQGKYFYIDWIDKKEQIMHKVRLYDYFGEGGQLRGFPRIYLAESAWIKDGYLILSKVRLYNLDQNTGSSLVSAAMPEVKIDIGTQMGDLHTDQTPAEMTASQLRLRIGMKRDRLSSLSFPDPESRKAYLQDWTEYCLKYSVPVACIALVLVAVPVSLRGPRDERNLGIILSFLLMMAYYVIFFSCRVLGPRAPALAKDIIVGNSVLLHKGANLFPPYVAGWLPVVVFFVWGSLLIWHARK